MTTQIEVWKQSTESKFKMTYEGRMEEDASRQTSLVLYLIFRCLAFWITKFTWCRRVATQTL